MSFIFGFVIGFILGFTVGSPRKAKNIATVIKNQLTAPEENSKRK